MIYEVTIPLNPMTKKNGMIKTKKGLIQGKRYRDYEKATLKYLSVTKKPKKPIEGKVNLELTFYRKTRHNVDLSNCIEAIQDILVKGGILKDDNYKIVGGLDRSRVFIDKENPRTEVKITRMEDENEGKTGKKHY